MQDSKQAPVCLCAGLCRGREVYSGTRPNFPAPAGALLRFEDGIMVVQKALSGEQRGFAAGQRPDKDFGRLFTFASDKGFLE